MRLVCRAFNKTLKPYACRTLALEFSRLSKANPLPSPEMDALQTIGYHCKSLYIDLMVLRDESMFFLFHTFSRIFEIKMMENKQAGYIVIFGDPQLTWRYSGGRISQHGICTGALDDGILQIAAEEVLYERDILYRD